jgi:flavin reductase (DIM6/NTAB) family NADH-FMN oxidoreductase RutF
MQFDFQAMKPMDRYELLLGTILPRPITIVTTLSVDRALNAAPSYRRILVTVGVRRQRLGVVI